MYVTFVLSNLIGLSILVVRLYLFREYIADVLG